MTSERKKKKRIGIEMRWEMRWVTSERKNRDPLIRQQPSSAISPDPPEAKFRKCVVRPDRNIVYYATCTTPFPVWEKRRKFYIYSGEFVISISEDSLYPLVKIIEKREKCIPKTTEQWGN